MRHPGDLAETRLDPLRSGGTRDDAHDVILLQEKTRSVPSGLPSGSRPFPAGSRSVPNRLPADSDTGPEVRKSPVRSGAPFTHV
ncbi:hypothetical protein GCM10018952_77330 [Streptosporangium vulgare]